MTAVAEPTTGSADDEYGAAFPQSKKVYVSGPNGIRVPFREIALSGGEPPLRVYDTSGPRGHDVHEGLPPLREQWIRARGARRRDRHYAPPPGARSLELPAGLVRGALRGTRNVTQLHYARRNEITPEMEFVALREGLPAEFVRSEIARGRAILPANINHPEIEPMIIGRGFAVKINANIGNSAVSSSIAEEVEKLRWSTLWRLPSRRWISPRRQAQISRWRALVDHRPSRLVCRSARCPFVRRWRRWGGKPEELTWELYRDTLIEQAEQGVDYFTVHAAVLLRYVPMTANRRRGIVSRVG